MQYVYDFATLDAVPEGPTSATVTPKRLLSGPSLSKGKSSTVGAVLKGDRIILTLGTQARGTGARPHTHPNEQFNYMLRGTMTWEVEGELIFAGPGKLMHTPAQAVHTGLACPDEDTIFLAMKDTRHGIVGPPVDGVYNGPNYLPGFGTRAGEPFQTTAQMMAAAARDTDGVKKRFVYAFDDLAEKPGRTPSAKVRRGPPSESGAAGSVISGEMLHIARLAYPARGASRVRSNPAEQFAFVVSGSLTGEIAGQAVKIGPHSIAHIPAGVAHALAAEGQEALVIVCQDSSHAFAA
jgi:quercetin dioxygenase-like cupin family protein